MVSFYFSNDKMFCENDKLREEMSLYDMWIAQNEIKLVIQEFVIGRINSYIVNNNISLRKFAQDNGFNASNLSKMLNRKLMVSKRLEEVCFKLPV